ncbi:ABC-ATPase domain-containing protein [Sciscionella marina]|uniref:ABC-ATPase domain-containing protein n=1 Tax=Sciscionella marina TaxID=508770 RepID=UPI00037A98ED|nr:ABC-ATPase domain-containing protein [Sciscionella marina]
MAHGSLADLLRRIDRGGYGQYRRLSGTWELDRIRIEVQRVQADPFAPPSRIGVTVPAEIADLAPELWRGKARATALASYLVRRLAVNLRGGAFRVDAGGQEVLARSSSEVSDGIARFRIGIQLPGKGRTIDGVTAHRLLCEQLPEAVRKALDFRYETAREFVETVEDSAALRDKLPELGLVAFVADSALLPRRSGIDDRPLESGGISFRSPGSLATEVELPNRGTVSGMGIPEGITLIVGGGFHGKSTLLRAIERGIYDHVPGDGRELVVARTDTAKIRAEDGRGVERVDVRPFVGELPTGSDTGDFSTENASGSTSQAASIIEAVEAGAHTLLVDEDTAATNLMIRDARMQALVGKSSEPLTPFVDLVRPLHAEHQVSTVIVMGGSGDYLDIADRVLMLDSYTASEVTGQARAIAATPTGRAVEASSFGPIRHRSPEAGSVDARGKNGRTRIRNRGTDTLLLGESEIDLRALDQIVDPSQVTGIGLAIEKLARSGALTETIAAALAHYEAELAGVPVLGVGSLDDFVVPRALDIAAALNRLRTLRIRDLKP